MLEPSNLSLKRGILRLPTLPNRGRDHPDQVVVKDPGIIG